MQFPQVECPVIHHFGPGVYIREVRLPAGSMIIGHHQKHEHMNVFLQGRGTFLNADGTVAELKAPMLFVAPPGRKVCYVYEDIVWLNIYPTKETDVEKLEDYFLDKSESWKTNTTFNEGINDVQNEVDRTDYIDFLREFSLTSFGVTEAKELPYGSWKVRVDKSKIEGKGLFATATLEEDEFIAPAWVKGEATTVGRYINHSATPNAKMVKGPVDDIFLVALKRIVGCHGGYNGEEITVNYREVLKLQGES